MNLYYQMLDKIMSDGRTQTNKKGGIKYLTNEVLHLTPADLLDIFETHGIARKKLKTELSMFQAGITIGVPAKSVILWGEEEVLLPLQNVFCICSKPLPTKSNIARRALHGGTIVESNSKTVILHTSSACPNSSRRSMQRRRIARTMCCS